MPETQMQTPQIRTFQFDTGGIGSVDSSVNLFRGDVNLVQDVVSLDGRPGKSELDVKLSLLYQSNVRLAAAASNLDSPTSIVGLGWDFPLERIQLEAGHGESVAPAARSYSFIANGVANQLTREPVNPVRFSAPIELAQRLVDGQPVGTDWVTAFAEMGIPLDPIATASQEGLHAWTIMDTANEQIFTVDASAAESVVSDGGEAYQLQDYRFWRILYYTAFERWVIVEESGLVSSYGGGLGTVGNLATSAGNSVTWNVRWARRDTGAALWRGDSSVVAPAGGLPTQQQQYATSWYLVSRADPWGDAVRYAYNEFERQDGLLPGVEQAVGSARGLPFTKACYLTSINDVFGRRIELTYLPKSWGPRAGDPREYLDPHRAVPAHTPNSYQDCYETLYLDRISVLDTGGSQLFSVRFGYRLMNVSSYDRGDELYGDTCKRVLTSITQSDAFGVALPGLSFDYYDDLSVSGASPGALRGTTYPGGGTVCYSYTETSLTSCQRRVVIDLPTEVGSVGPTPRVWFGSDYVVSTWYDNVAGKLSLRVFTWLGYWAAWQLDSASSLIFDDPAELTNLDVVTAETFFVLSFSSAEATCFYVFSADTAVPGNWVPYNQADGCNQPSISIARSDGTAAITAGTAYFAILVTAADGSCSLTRHAFQWATNSWLADPAPSTYPGITWVAGANEYLFVLSTGGSQATASVQYLDPQGSWHQGDLANFTSFRLLTRNLQIPGLGPVPAVALTAGASFVAVGGVTNATWNSSAEYALAILQWDERYKFVPTAASWKFSDHITIGQRWLGIPYLPQVMGNALVGCGGNLVRFDGSRWLLNKGLGREARRRNFRELRYAYGPDYGVRCTFAPSGADGALMVFDPDTDCGTWTRAAALVPAAPATPTAQPQLANWPTAGGADFFTFGQSVYRRGTSTNWESALAAPVLAMGDVADTESLVNECPNFIGYYTGTGQTAATAALIFRNGEVNGAPESLGSEKYYTISEGTVGTGTRPAGPGSFVTYPSSSPTFAQAPQVFLYRYTAESISKPISHYPVTGIAVSDGLGDVHRTTYSYDASTAAVNPTGDVVKYYAVTTYPGSGSADGSVSGCTVTHYVNGMQPGLGANYDMLDGYLADVATFDAAASLVARTTNTWQVFRQRSLDPLGVALGALHGGFVRQVRQVQVQDGVTTTRSTSFVPDGVPAPYSGQPVRSTISNYGGAGTAETLSVEQTYAYSVSPSAAALNMLAPVVQSVTTWLGADGSKQVTSASATTLVPWPANVCGLGIQVPGADASFSYAGGGSDGPSFPFASYTPGQVPSGWQRRSQVLARTPLGLVRSSQDAVGVVSSVLYDTAGRFAVATFANAGLGECAYIGFEEYENLAGWELAGTTPTAGDAHSGSNALALGVGATASCQVDIAAGAAAYLLGYWCKTPPGFVGNQAGWTVQPQHNGQPVGSPAGSLFADTSGLWTYATVSIPVPSGATVLLLRAANTSAGTVLIDDVVVQPLEASFQATAYDPDYMVATATVSADGGTSRFFSDSYQRLVATTRPDESVASVSSQFLSSQGSSGGQFDPAHPGCLVTVEPTGVSIVETFSRGDDWKQRWLASNSATNWGTSGGALLHHSATADSLSPVAPTAGPTALFVDVQAPNGATLAASLGIGLGGSFSATWDPTASTWQLLDGAGTRLQAPLATPPEMGRQWLAAALNGLFLLWADGLLIFSYRTAGLVGPPSIMTGPNELEFRNLTWMAEPKLAVSYRDGTGRSWQDHQLLDEDSIIRQTIYDSLGRAAVVTKPAPGSFGTGATHPVLAYRSGFVDVPGFLAAMDTTGVMTGDVAEYWGPSEDPTRSDDGGYPYFRKRFESSPLSRVIEEGAPGASYAIANPGVSGPSTRPTVQYTFAANSEELLDPVTLPAQEYFLQSQINQVKVFSERILDQANQLVAKAVVGPLGSDARSHSVTTYSAGGKETDIDLPNAVAGNPGFTIAVSYDLLGRMTARTDSDTGTTLFMYDSANRLRFKQLQPDTGAPPCVLYFKYDGLGRMTERGTIAFDWTASTASTLQSHADDPTWPSAASTPPAVSARSFEYDGDGTVPTRIGRLIAVHTSNPRDRAGHSVMTVVEERYEYLVTGETVSVITRVTDNGVETPAYQLTYGYDNSRHMTAAAYPAVGGHGPWQVAYEYDDLGRVSEITATGTNRDSLAQARYTYTADGLIATETMLGSITRESTYEAPGWLSTSTTSVGGRTPLAQTFHYDPDGTISRTREVIDFGGQTTTQTISYGFDDLSRVTTATASAPELSQSVSGYDANGNINSIAARTTDATFTYVAGSNQLDTVSLTNGPPLPVTYDGEGRVLSAPHPAVAGATNSYRYDPAIGLTAMITVDLPTTSQVEFSYGAGGFRTIRRLTTPAGQVTTLYLRGTQVAPALELSSDGGLRAYFYGPTGPFAAWIVPAGSAASGSLVVPLADREGSVRAILDAGGNPLEGYDYVPFGATAVTRGEGSVGFSYRFTGEEWDPATGLYDLHARLYDPTLARFLAPDPARQFASPYIYAADDPIMEIDPSGAISLWAQIGIGAAMAAIAAAGIILTIPSGGTSDELAAAGDAALAGSEAGAAAGASAGSSSVAAAAAQIGGSTLTGIGIAGGKYDVTHGSSFSWEGFGAAVAGGAAAGIVSGGIGFALSGAPDAAAATMSSGLAKFGAKVVVSAGIGAISGTASGLATQEVNNAVTGNRWNSGLDSAAATGAWQGAAQGAAKSGAGPLYKAALAKWPGLASDAESIRVAASSNTAKIYYGLIGGHVALGWGLWGFYKWESHSAF